MSLQGTFDVFSLPELLRMLAASGQSGALVVDAGGVAGRIDLRGGECVAAENVEQRGAVSGADALHARLVDVCFAVLRETGGGFRFAAGEAPVFDAEATVAVEPVLADVELLAAEWRELAQRIPSLDVRPVLKLELATESITLSALEWSVVAACDGHTSVRGLVEADRRTVVAACRTVADLVDRGAIVLADPMGIEPATPAPADGVSLPYYAPPRRVEPVAPYGPGIDPPGSSDRAVPAARPEPTEVQLDADLDGGAGTTPPEPPTPPMAAAEHDVVATAFGEVADDGDGDVRDRGAILRLFSALREG